MIYLFLTKQIILTAYILLDKKFQINIENKTKYLRR